MESTSLLSSSPSLIPSSKMGFSHHLHKRVFVSTRICASHEQNYNGRLVDESMIVLRRRIHETKMAERNYEPPEEWADWEKSCYTIYDSTVFEFMGFLQSQLNTRPCVALGMLAVIVLSLPTSAAAVLFYMMEISKSLLAGIHLS